MEQAGGRPDLLTKFLTVALLLGTAVFAQSNFAQSGEESIRAVLDRQVTDWNRGDVRAFMEGYHNSDATLFIGSSVIRGHKRVLENYLARYSTRDQMGRLTFSNLEVRPLGQEHALVLGNFHLERSAAGG